MRRSIRVTMLAAVVVGLVTPVGSARPRPQPCDPGRYFVDGGLVLVDGDPPPSPDVLALGDTLEILSGCPPVAFNERVRRSGTRIKATFTGCTGLAGRARLKARIDPDCLGMRGVFRARKDRIRKEFTATRSICGDGILDAGGGEACDGSEGCSGGSCVDCACTTATTSTIPGTTTSTSTSTTTTTSSSLTTTTCLAQPPELPALRVIPVNAAATSFATFAAQPPGSTDWYVVEQRGRIVIVRGGAVLDPPFLDIRAAMGTNAGERGLLSVAFHPDYATNGRFFTMGTPAAGADGSYAPTDADAVVEWMRDPADPDVALATKVRDVVVLGVSDDNHNGGTILFGPDGYLYVGTGDGGGGCESAQPGAVQDTTTLFGKILRLDVDAPPPFAAPGNPFANDPRVYHYGLRNPFRFGFDRLTHDLFIGDVGQDAYEEVSAAPGDAAGLNFGWPAYEGAVEGTCGSRPLGGPSPHAPPIVSIDRRPGSTSPFADYESIIGGRVYRGTAIPALQGVYLFADFFGDELGALRYCDGQPYGPVAVPLSQIPTPGGSVSTITSFAEGNDGEIYVTYGLTTRVGRLAPQ